MSTSFPNTNGNVPPYNPQANGSFNQYPQGGPPGAYPPMEHFHHNMYPPNGYGMPPGQPNMGGPAQPAPPMPQKTPTAQQYPGGGGGMKLPPYDNNSMMNGYMGYPPQHQRPPGQAPQNGPPPNYNAQQMPPPNNPYAPVHDPYRMYPPMGAQAAQPPNPATSSAQQRLPSQNNGVPSQATPNQTTPHQYPTQQPLPPNMQGGPQYQGMPSANAPPLQHYQPSNNMNGTTPGKTIAQQAFPPLQPPKQAKPEEQRPNNAAGAVNPHQPFPGQYDGPGAPYESFGAAPGGYPGYGQPNANQAGPGNVGMNGGTTPGGAGSFGFNPSLYAPANQSTSGQPPGHGTPTHQASGHHTPGHHTPGNQTPGNQTPGHQTPGHQAPGHQAPGHHTPGHQTPGHQTPGNHTPGHTTSGQNTPSATTGPPGNPFASMGSQGGNQGHFQTNDTSNSHGNSGNYGSMNPTQAPNIVDLQADRGTPGQPTPKTPGTPGSHGMGASNVNPLSHHKPPQQPGMQNNMQPPQYNQNNLMSPTHVPNGNTPQKHPSTSPMGSSLPPLNGYTPMAHNMQSPAASTTSEPTFKEPAIPIRHSPSHLQSPAHPPPNGAPPAYNAPSSSTRIPETSSASTPARPTEPTFAVPTLPAAATLAQASSANQVSTKPKTSPPKKRADGVPEPPTQETPFTLVTHYELPATTVVLRDTLTVGPDKKLHPQVEKHYFSRKRQQLRVPYPEGTNAKNAPVVEPDTFGFMQGTKYFDQKYHRINAVLQTAPPVLSRSQSMLVSPGFNATQPSSSGRQPAKKARSASDASEPVFNAPLPPGPRQPSRPPVDPRVQQIQMQQYHHNMQMKMHQQQQMAAHQQHMARMAQAGNGAPTSNPAVPPALVANTLPPLTAPPALQRTESMPQLPSQQQPAMGNAMPPHMGGGLPPLNGNPAEGYYRPDGQSQYWARQQPLPPHNWPSAPDFGKPGPGWDTKP
ncbi:unnamed protein product [Caenorhabditis brenneri]